MARFNRRHFKKLREAFGSQEALARKVGVARNTINRIEMGDREPSPDLRHRLARALGVAVRDLTGGQMESYGYQHEKIGDGVRMLMSCTGTPQRRIASAMHEFFLAFHNRPVPLDAEPYRRKIAGIMGGPGLYEEQAARLTDDQRTELTTAFWELDRVLSREYHEAMAR